MKTCVIFHEVDLDGFMSAAIVKHWFKSTYSSYMIAESGKENLDFKNDFNKERDDLPFIEFIGYTYGQPIPDLSGYDKVIMVDISFPMNIMTSLSHNLGVNFIWVDHHISAIKNWNYVIEPNPQSWILEGIRDTNFAACELTWKYFFPNDKMPEIVRLLGRYDCFGSRGTDEEQKVLEFQYGARQYINNIDDAYDCLRNELLYNKAIDKENLVNQRVEIWKSGISIYRYLCIEAKQSYKNGFCVTFPNVTIPEEEYNFICINKERFNLINFGIDYHKDGYDGCACFHYDGQRKLWAFSLYNDNGLVDCSAIAKQYAGGGHRGASGFVTKDLKGIIE